MLKREHPQPLQMYQLLPRTNCKVCGCEGCFAFAFALIKKEKKTEDCPDLQSEEFASSLSALREMLGSAVPIEGTAFALDRDICTGCGDCLQACKRVITLVNPSGDVIYHREQPPPVLQVIDGKVQVINWSSCKRMMSTPDLCRVCAEKCPFGALELL